MLTHGMTLQHEIRKIYALCGAKHVNVPYVNEETAFTMEFSRQDRNFWMHWEMKNSLLQN